MSGASSSQWHEWQSGDRRARAPRKSFCRAIVWFHSLGIGAIRPRLGLPIPRIGHFIAGTAWGMAQRARDVTPDNAAVASDSSSRFRSPFATSGGNHAGHMSNPEEIRLVGPGGAGKSTIGALLAERLEVALVDLDRHLAGRIGDISEYIGRHGYDAYARENVETYCSLVRGECGRGVVALSSGFMTYARDIHPDYSRVRRELEQHPHTFVLLPSFDRDVCVAETVRRQIARPFGRPSAKEEAVIRVPVRDLHVRAGAEDRNHASSCCSCRRDRRRALAREEMTA